MFCSGMLTTILALQVVTYDFENVQAIYDNKTFLTFLVCALVARGVVAAPPPEEGLSTETTGLSPPPHPLVSLLVRELKENMIGKHLNTLKIYYSIRVNIYVR